MSFPSIRHEIRSMLTLAVPVIIGQLSTLAMQLIDVVMLGHYDSVALSGMALGHAVSSFGLLVFTGVVSAIAPMVSQLHGAGREREAGAILGQGIWLSLALSLILMGVLHFTREILIFTGQEPGMAECAQSYVTPLSFGYIPALLFMTLRQYVEGLSITRPAMVIALVLLPLNAGLNLLLIFGHWGFPAMGAAGAGIATAISFWVGLPLMIAYVWGRDRFAKFGVKSALTRPHWVLLKPILTLGVPIAATIGTEVSAFVGASLMMGWFGALPMASHQIVLSLSSFTFMIPLGVSIAGTVRVGLAEGRKDRVGLRRAGWVAFGLAACFMLFNAVVFLLFAREIVGLYTHDEAVISIAAGLLRVAAAFQLVDGLQVAGIGVLRGLKDTRVPMLANVAAYWVIGIPVGYVLGTKTSLGPAGIWWGLAAGLSTAALSHLLRFRWWTSSSRD